VEKFKMLTAICLFIIWLIVFLFLNVDEEDLNSVYILGGSVITLLMISAADLKSKKKLRKDN